MVEVFSSTMAGPSLTEHYTTVKAGAIERAPSPADLVGAVMLLCAAASDFMTGQTVNVGGGRRCAFLLQPLRRLLD